LAPKIAENAVRGMFCKKAFIKAKGYIIIIFIGITPAQALEVA
jgi:hypothetical protein